MKIGLIARPEIALGLGIQTRSFFENMPVERTMLIQMPRTSPSPANWDGWGDSTIVRYDDMHHELPQAEVRRWMDGLDVVWTAETPYDWNLPRWARMMGVKTVVQGNPEFVRHGRIDGEGLGDPDDWWWPSSWRLKHLPAGPVMPCPMPDDIGIVAAPALDTRPLRILHVAGKRAFGDRNGTDIFAGSLRCTTQRLHVTMYSLDFDLPDIRPQDNLTIERFQGSIENRWDMYKDQHMLVLPRRYGGNCLPALEAAACGLAVALPDVSPNNEDIRASVYLPTRGPRSLSLACGPIQTAEVNHMDLGRTLDRVALDRRQLAVAQDISYRTVPRWSTWRPKYLERLEALCAKA